MEELGNNIFKCDCGKIFFSLDDVRDHAFLRECPYADKTFADYAYYKFVTTKKKYDKYLKSLDNLRNNIYKN